MTKNIIYDIFFNLSIIANDQEYRIRYFFIQQMTKNIVYDKNGIPRISYRTVTGTVRNKEFKKQRIYKNKEVIPYYNFFKV